MKKAVLHTTALIHYKDRQVLLDLFSTNYGNDSEMTLVVGATNDLMTWCRQQFGSINHIWKI